ncbi:MAG: membrane protein insertase YidC, partial [Fidelibacterota bacterium]
MDKRTVLAFLFIAVILMFTPYYYKMVGLAERDDEKEPPPSTVRKEATEDLSPVARGEQASAEPRQRAASRFALGAPQEDAVSFRVDSDLYSATVSSRGGGTFTSFKLKHYKTHGGDLVDLVYPPINGSNVVVQFKDLSGETFTLDYPFSPPDAFYPGQTLPVGPGGLTLTFHTEIDGRTVSKAVTFHADSYIIDIRVDLSQISEQLISQEKFTLTWRGGLPATEENAPADIREFAGFLYQGGEQIRTKHKKSDVHAVAGTGRTAWAAIRSKYFTAALIPRDDSNFGQVVAGPYNPPREADAPPPDYSMAVGFSSKQPVLCSLYLGPLKYSRIKSLNVGLENTMSFGISVIRPISKGVLLLLTSMHKIVPNYG